MNKPAGPILVKYINSHEVSPLVNHEVLITLGWIIDDKSLIEPFLKHPDLLVSESCEASISVIEMREKEKNTSVEDEMNRLYGDEDGEDEQE